VLQKIRINGITNPQYKRVKMKRLYNEHSACPHWGSDAKLISDQITDAFDTIWDKVVIANDICPRDAESLCHSTLATLFAQCILQRAMEKRLIERKKS
jgi:predicted nucleotide-binding protein (sugar kinase/HSP70/actin superfamily)